MLNEVRIGKIKPIEIEKISVQTGVKKLPIIDIDESQNPLTVSRTNKLRANSTLRTNRSRSLDNTANTFNKSTSDSNLKTMVKTFFNYNINSSSCEPSRIVSETPNTVQSAYKV